MLAQDLQMFAFNIFLILGALVLLIILFFVAMAAWTATRMLIHLYRGRRAMREYRARHFRADGEPYPPFMEGTCSACHRGDAKIYFEPGGEELCPPCYEASWRRAKGWPVNGIGAERQVVPSRVSDLESQGTHAIRGQAADGLSPDTSRTRT